MVGTLPDRQVLRFCIQDDIHLDPSDFHVESGRHRLLTKNETFYKSLSSAAIDNIQRFVEPHPKPFKATAPTRMDICDGELVTFLSTMPVDENVLPGAMAVSDYGAHVRDRSKTSKPPPSEAFKTNFSPSGGAYTAMCAPLSKHAANTSPSNIPLVSTVAVSEKISGFSIQRSSTDASKDLQECQEVTIAERKGILSKLRAKLVVPNGKKRVRFQLKKLVKVEIKGQSLRPMQLTDDDVAKLWWSKDERNAMRDREKVAAYRFLSSRPNFELVAEHLLLKCSNDNDVELGLTSQEHTPAGNNYSYDEALRMLVNHNERGLEGILIKALKIESCHFYNNSHKSMVARVLETQDMLKSLVFCSGEEKTSIIALNLSLISAVSARFARMLAEGDAHVASGAYDGASIPVYEESSPCKGSILKTISLNKRYLML
jgi:hypothetical protein